MKRPSQFKLRYKLQDVNLELFVKISHHRAFQPIPATISNPN
jgi:hypothetical protein